MNKIALLAGVILLLIVCDPENQVVTETPIDTPFNDSSVVAIHQAADMRNAAELSKWLNHTHVEYRWRACLAAGNLQDSTLLVPLYNLCAKDSSEDVRCMAAWAVGQTARPSSVAVLGKIWQNEKSSLAGSALLEAIGKCLQPADFLSYPQLAPKDPAQLSGWMWGLYRLMLKDRYLPVKKTVIPYLSHSDYGVKIIAAYIIQRSKQEINNEEIKTILPLLKGEETDFESALVMSLGRTSKSRPPSVDSLLKSWSINQNMHPSMRSAALIARDMLELKLGLDEQHLLEEKNLNIALAAALLVSHHSGINDVEQLEKAIESPNIPIAVKAELYKKHFALFALQSPYMDTVMKMVMHPVSGYAQSALIRAIPLNSETEAAIFDLLADNAQPLLQSTVAEWICAPQPAPIRSQKLANRLLELADAGALAVLADFDRMAGDSWDVEDSILEQSLKTCELPLEVETYNALIQAWNSHSNHLNQTRQLIVPEWNNPIDWDKVKKIPLNQRAIIRTNKGNIEILLHVNECPGTVAEFVKLVETGFYTDKYFHRVVPNFVIQTGCPRGDGWGGIAESIRSEFSPKPYFPGSMGMASSGKDTESCQWFITHSSTPHLEGRYTLFANVTEGMDVVDRIDIGDKIHSVQMVP
jgi:cyclophilin family peptidyl-prolyl cis-trans isomerase